MTTDTKIALLEAPVTVIKLNIVPSQGFTVVANVSDPHDGDEYSAYIEGSLEVVGTATGGATDKRVLIQLEKQALLKHAGKEVKIYYIRRAADTGNDHPSEPTRFLISLA